jgi:hypothetical protein
VFLFAGLGASLLYIIRCGCWCEIAVFNPTLCVDSARQLERCVNNGGGSFCCYFKHQTEALCTATESELMYHSFSTAFWNFKNSGSVCGEGSGNSNSGSSNSGSHSGGYCDYNRVVPHVYACVSALALCDLSS